MWGILTGIKWHILLIGILIVGSVISGCSPVSKRGVETMVPKLAT